MDDRTTVLIAGGSLNGLTLALLLAQRKVRCLVVERHPRTSIQYKFRGISPRSMEVYRSAGIEADIRARDLIDDRLAAVARMQNLADTDVAWQGVPWSDTSGISPTTAATCDQDQLEPILRAHAERHGARMRFNAELLDFTQDAGALCGRIRDRASGAETRVQADYLVAADGADSPIRAALGIDRHGPGVLQHWMNVIFEADLPATLQGKAMRSVFLTDINGTFVPRGDGRWLMAVQYVPERGERAEDFTPERCQTLIRRGAGQPDLAVRVIDARPWDAAAAVADRYSHGRAFLVGDSAHVMPPTGGFGGNTGIQDAYNLAWKLDAVRQGAAEPSLLETYDAERRPIADRTVAQALARLQAWFKDPSRKLPPPEPIVEDNRVIFGYRYPSGAFVPEAGPEDLFEDPTRPSARPGSRAPQVFVRQSGREMSTIDRFAGRWVLAHGAKGEAWTRASERSAAARSIEVEAYALTTDADGHEARHDALSKYGVDADGAVLIRPDGFIAWRCRSAPRDAVLELDRAVRQILTPSASHERDVSARPHRQSEMRT